MGAWARRMATGEWRHGDIFAVQVGWTGAAFSSLLLPLAALYLEHLRSSGLNIPIEYQVASYG